LNLLWRIARATAFLSETVELDPWRVRSARAPQLRLREHRPSLENLIFRQEIRRIDDTHRKSLSGRSSNELGRLITVAEGWARVNKPMLGSLNRWPYRKKGGSLRTSLSSYPSRRHTTNLRGGRSKPSLILFPGSVLVLSRLKQGFDSPRERQQFQRFKDALATAILVFSNFSPIE